MDTKIPKKFDIEFAWTDCSIAFYCPYCDSREWIMLDEEPRSCKSCGKTFKLRWSIDIIDSEPVRPPIGPEWERGNPPVTKEVTGDGSLIWYDVLYKDGARGRACWWHDHWYCNHLWGDIIAHKLPLDK